MSQRARTLSDGEDQPNSIASMAAAADKQNKNKKSATRTMSLKGNMKPKKTEEQPKPRTRTFSLRNPDRVQMKLKEKANDCKKHLKINGNYEYLACYTLKSKKTFILTPTHFFLTQKNFKPENKDSYIFPWNYLKKFSVQPDQVKLTFNTMKSQPDPKEKLEFTLSFDKDEYDDGVSKVCNTIQNVLVPRELRALKFYNLNAPPVQITAQSALYRFRMLNSVAKLNSKATRQVEDIIIYAQPEIDISRFDQEVNKMIPIIFKLLPFLYNVQTVKVPPSDLDIYEDAFNAIKDSTSLLAIRLSGKCGEKLQQFLEYIKQAPDRGTQLSGLIFNHSNFTSNELEGISNFISYANVRSIGFNSAIENDSMPDFYSSFLTPKVTDQLLCLNLDGTHNLDLDKIFPRLRKVALLSLENCNLNILKVFQLLNTYSVSMSQLRMINLSQNLIQIDEDLSEFPSLDSKLPSRLTGFVMNGITWVNTLKSFFEFIFSHVDSKLKLSLSDADENEQQWQELFELFGESEYGGFSELIWDNNPINENLFSLLEKSQNMIRLQVNGCFTSKMENEVNSLCSFVKNSPKLEGLVVRNGKSEEQHLGKNVVEVIKAAKEAPELLVLDVGNSRVGEVDEDEENTEDTDALVKESLELLSALCKDSQKLKYLNYDGMMPNSADPYVETLNQLNEYSDRIKISFPINDLEYLNSEDQLSDKQLNKIKRHFAFVMEYTFPEIQTAPKDSKKKNDQVKINAWDGSIFNKPSNLYRLYDPPVFPLYVSFKVADKLKKTAQPFSFSINEQEEADDLKWDPEATQPERSLTQENFDHVSDPESKPAPRKNAKKQRPKFGSVRIPNTKSMGTFKKVLGKSNTLALQSEIQKNSLELARREREARENQQKEAEERQQREKEEREREEREEREREEREQREREQREREQREREERDQREREEREQ